MKVLLFLLFPIIFFLECKTTPEPHQTVYEEILWTSSWSPDGKYIAVGGNHGMLKIYSGEAFNLIKSYPEQHTITKLKWHPNKPLLAITTQPTSEKMGMLNVETDESIELEGFPPQGSRAFGWSSDEALIAVGTNEGLLYFFDKHGSFLKKIETEQKSITGLSWHPLKNIIATVGKHIALYNYDTDELQFIKPRPENVLMLCVQWHPTGEFFVTGDYGNYDQGYPPLLQFWTATGEKIRDIVESKAEYRNMDWSNDGERLATASESLRIWSKDGKLLKKSKPGYLLWGVGWNDDDSQIVTSNEKGMVEIWNKNAKQVREIK